MSNEKYYGRPGGRPNTVQYNDGGQFNGVSFMTINDNGNVSFKGKGGVILDDDIVFANEVEDQVEGKAQTSGKFSRSNGSYINVGDNSTLMNSGANTTLSSRFTPYPTGTESTSNAREWPKVEPHDTQGFELEMSAGVHTPDSFDPNGSDTGEATAGSITIRGGNTDKQQAKGGDVLIKSKRNVSLSTEANSATDAENGQLKMTSTNDTKNAVVFQVGRTRYRFPNNKPFPGRSLGVLSRHKNEYQLGWI